LQFGFCVNAMPPGDFARVLNSVMLGEVIQEVDTSMVPYLMEVAKA
jgi:hypothetical protein